jgi:hypothetical protein
MPGSCRASAIGVFHEHRRHDEEPGGDRDLPAQQRPLTARLRRAEDADARRQLSPEIARARQLQRRFEPEHDRGYQQGPRRDPERRGVWRRTYGQDPASSHGKHEVEFDVHQDAEPLEDDVSRQAARRRQEEAFGALLATRRQRDAPRARRTGNFVLSRRTSREHEIREVRAGDGEHQGHQRDDGPPTRRRTCPHLRSPPSFSPSTAVPSRAAAPKGVRGGKLVSRAAAIALSSAEAAAAVTGGASRPNTTSRRRSRGE